jgi:hypothetical protein
MYPEKDSVSTAVNMAGTLNNLATFARRVSCDKEEAKVRTFMDQNAFLHECEDIYIVDQCRLIDVVNSKGHLRLMVNEDNTVVPRRTLFFLQRNTNFFSLSLWKFGLQVRIS